MKALCITLLYLGCLAAIIYAPEFWPVAGIVGFFGTFAIDGIEED